MSISLFNDSLTYLRTNFGYLNLLNLRDSKTIYQCVDNKGDPYTKKISGC